MSEAFVCPPVMLRRSEILLLFMALFGTLLLAPQRAMGQSALTQQQQTSSEWSQPKPLSLAHLYWHFLVYQNHLDTKAAALNAQGIDGSKMHNYMQNRLGLSDTDFTAVRTSSVRLTAEVNALDAQAATILVGGHTSTSYAQLSALTVQRETDINAEISYLKQLLSPAQIAALESFLTSFYAPTTRPSSLGLLTGPTAVKQ